MNRRNALKTLAVAGGAQALPAQSKRPIQLHVDLDVDPARENEMLANFRKVFRPVISKQPGFVSVRMLRFREAMQGAAPANKYRLVISFQTEEQRKTWVATDDHQRVWPSIENTLRHKNYLVILYDTM
ncbi:MAG: antibiotic biosynthesis monooxygenase [Bryobacterales bacterium]|nr:antibiotic biosynthesis monooxygenase [Bryobacterales bacterium]